MQISIDNLSHQDKLGRVAFTRHMLDLIERVDAEFNGAVIGLEGSWGSGKTRVLSSLQILIEEQPEETRPLLIQFNPWMVSGTSGLVEALLLQMAAGIAPNIKNGILRIFHRLSSSSEAAKLATDLIDYASILSTVKNFGPVANMLLPGSGLVFSAVASASETVASTLNPAKGTLKGLRDKPYKLSLIEVRHNVEKQLKTLGRRVIVVIDDLDRLPPHELATMIQAVKAVADFPNVIYVLAYAPDIAAKALEDALSVKDGRAFLEKIIQIPLPLPEIPTRRFSPFALDRLKSSLELTEISVEAQQDLEAVLPLVAALMVTPRDVERLRTRLLIATPILKNEVNIADIVLLEAMSLKASKVVEWILNNISAVISPGLSQFDEDLIMRGQLGAQISEFALTEKSDKDLKEKLAYGWTELLPSELRYKIPIRLAMEFLFDKCKPNWGTSPKRTNYRRVQDFRYWYSWRCYNDHHEKWQVSEIEELLREPNRILETGLLNNPDLFREFCQQVCSIGLDGLSHVDSMAFVEVIRQAEEVFGTEFMIDMDVGFGPLQALIIVLRLNLPDNRVQSLQLLIKEVSVWLSGRIVLLAHRELFNPRAEEQVSEENRLISTREFIAPILEDWFAIADEHVKATSWLAPSTDYTPYTLLSWMNLMQREAKTIRKLAENFIQDNPERMKTFFANFVDKPGGDLFPLNVGWNFLPNYQNLLRLAEFDPEFSQKYSRLMTELRKHSDRGTKAG